MASTADNAAAGTDTLRRDLAVSGMTCAACANRIQRKLSRLDGVADAQVNFATGRATVLHGDSVSDDDLRVTIEGLGYGVIDEESGGSAEKAEAARQADLGRRLIVAAALATPAMILSMLMPLQFDGWEWVVAALATPVVLWSGWPFHRAAWMNLRHGSTTMDTLVSMGSLSSWLWSMVVVVGAAVSDWTDGHGFI